MYELASASPSLPRSLLLFVYNIDNVHHALGAGESKLEAGVGVHMHQPQYDV